jgi:hypothetical protein
MPMLTVTNATGQTAHEFVTAAALLKAIEAAKRAVRVREAVVLKAPRLYLPQGQDELATAQAELAHLQEAWSNPNNC